MKILYYTSTWNNWYIAKKLGGELLSIPQLSKNQIYDIEDDVVGIVFPVFFATSPKTIREYLEKVNIKADYLFLITSFGSDGDQNALKIMKETLNNKGINVDYTNSVLMIDNFLPVFDMAKERKLKRIWMWMDKLMRLRKTFRIERNISLIKNLLLMLIILKRYWKLQWLKNIIFKLAVIAAIA